MQVCAGFLGEAAATLLQHPLDIRAQLPPFPHSFTVLEMRSPLAVVTQCLEVADFLRDGSPQPPIPPPLRL
jgi:hypothetical protein